MWDQRLTPWPRKPRLLLPSTLPRRLCPLHPALLLAPQAISWCLLHWCSQGSICSPHLAMGNLVSLLHSMSKAWILQPEGEGQNPVQLLNSCVKPHRTPLLNPSQRRPARGVLLLRRHPYQLTWHVQNWKHPPSKPPPKRLISMRLS